MPGSNPKTAGRSSQKSQGLIEGPGREQQVAGLRTAPEPVTVVFSQRIAPHNEAEFVELHDDVVGRLRKFEGFLGSDLLHPVKGVQDEHVIVASFASRADLDRWLESDSRESGSSEPTNSSRATAR